jgi:hypothetical protein
MDIQATQIFLKELLSLLLESSLFQLFHKTSKQAAQELWTQLLMSPPFQLSHKALLQSPLVLLWFILQYHRSISWHLYIRLDRAKAM